MSDDPRDRTLFIRLSSMGDIVLTEPALRAYRAARPGAEVHFLTRARYGELAGMLPGVDRVLALEEGPRALASTLGALGRGGYRTVVNLQMNPLSLLLARWSGAAERCGYRKAALRRRLMPLGLGRAGVGHVAGRYLEGLAGLGIRVAVAGRPRLEPPAACLAGARAILEAQGWRGGRPLVAVAPGARWPLKRWPPGHFAGLIRLLRKRQGAWCMLLGEREEAAIAAEINSSLGEPAADLAGATSLPELAALLALADLAVTNDSGPLHLAAAVGTPVMAVFGPTVPELGFAPLGERDRVFQAPLPCRPCTIHGRGRCRLGDARCLESVAPEEVAAGALREVPA